MHYGKCQYHTAASCTYRQPAIIFQMHSKSHTEKGLSLSENVGECCVRKTGRIGH